MSVAKEVEYFLDDADTQELLLNPKLFGFQKESEGGLIQEGIHQAYKCRETMA